MKRLSTFRVSTGTRSSLIWQIGACIVASVALTGATIILAHMVFILGGFGS